MQLLIAAVGRLKDDAERVLVDRYAGRIGNGRVSGLGPLREIEITESRRRLLDGIHRARRKRQLHRHVAGH